MASEYSRHVINVIKYEGDNNNLIWKHPVEDFNVRSQLIVNESQMAVFVHDGQASDPYTAGRYQLDAERLPFFSGLMEKLTGGVAIFHSEVYFINTAVQMGIKWGTDSKVRLFDPASGLHVELGACGEFNIEINDAKLLMLRVCGTSRRVGADQIAGMGDGSGYFRAMIMTQVKAFLAQTIKANSINILEIDEHLVELSEALKILINDKLTEYGLYMPEFYISMVMTPDDDPNYKRLKEQHARQYLNVKEEQIRKQEAEAAAERKAVEAQTQAQMKIIGAKGDAEAMLIQKQAEAKAYAMQAEAEAAEMQMKGYTYQQETARQVGMEAMKNGIASGTGPASIMGDIAGMGVAIGTMESVIGVTKDALNPMAIQNSGMKQTAGNLLKPSTDSWECPNCGEKGIKAKFCPECGTKKPEPKKPKEAWDCPNCGAKGITSPFCPECGTKKPEPKGPEGAWNCPNCGAKDITSLFCPECGSKKPE